MCTVFFVYIYNNQFFIHKLAYKVLIYLYSVIIIKIFIRLETKQDQTLFLFKSRWTRPHGCQGCQQNWKGTRINTLVYFCTNTDKNIFDESYYIVSNTFPGCPVLGEQNCLLKVKAFI